MYAIIATGGKQYKVAEGDIIKVEKLGVEEGTEYTFDQVLAVNNGELVVGDPVVKNATVSATVMGNGRGKKVIVYKYKPKKRLSQEKWPQTGVYTGKDRKDQCIIHDSGSYFKRQ